MVQLNLDTARPGRFSMLQLYRLFGGKSMRGCFGSLARPSGRRRWHLPRPKSPEGGAAQPTEIKIDHGRCVKREELADQESADDRIAERLADLGAGAAAERERNATQERRHGGHHDRPEAKERGAV